MKIVNAIWEKRNLGVTCQEVTICKEATKDEITKLNSLSAEYQVVKASVDRPDLIFSLQNMGFIFAEVLFESIHTLRVPVLDKISSRYVSQVTCDQVDRKNIKKLIINISNGMFATDRVAIDPRFGLECSRRRYVGWINDEVNFGSKVFELKYKNHGIGFFVLNSDAETCLGKLGGIYEKSKFSGAGILLNYYEIIVARNEGFSKLKAWFSSNNQPIYRINETLGYNTRPLYNVFIKHTKT